MRKTKLTSPIVEAFKGGAAYETGKQAGQAKAYDVIWDTECRGFGVRYSMRTGSRTYFFQRRARGSSKDRTITFGQHGESVLASSIVSGEPAIPVVLNASTARDLAEKLKVRMKAGIDPVEERQKAKEEAKRQVEQTEEQKRIGRANSITLREVMEDYFKNHRTKRREPLRPATQADIRGACDRNLSDWLDKPIATITRKRCLERFEEITDRGAPSQANLTFAYLRALTVYARDMFEDEDQDGAFLILAVNPVSRMFKRRKMNPEVERKTRIPTHRIGHVWSMLRQRAREKRNATAADWASLLILTGLRRGESRCLTWSQINFDKRTLTIPASIAKNHQELVLPMSDLLHDILKARKPESGTGYVFPSRYSAIGHIQDSSEIKFDISKVAGTRVTLHDLRRTFVDICNAAKVDADRRRMLVNHRSSGVDTHAKHYDNDPSALPQAVEAVAAWVKAQADLAANANVVPLHAQVSQAPQPQGVAAAAII